MHDKIQFRVLLTIFGWLNHQKLIFPKYKLNWDIWKITSHYNKRSISLTHKSPYGPHNCLRLVFQTICVMVLNHILYLMQDHNKGQNFTSTVSPPKISREFGIWKIWPRRQKTQSQESLRFPLLFSSQIESLNWLNNVAKAIRNLYPDHRNDGLQVDTGQLPACISSRSVLWLYVNAFFFFFFFFFPRCFLTMLFFFLFFFYVSWYLV